MADTRNCLKKALKAVQDALNKELGDYIKYGQLIPYCKQQTSSLGKGEFSASMVLGPDTGFRDYQSFGEDERFCCWKPDDTDLEVRETTMAVIIRWKSECPKDVYDEMTESLDVEELALKALSCSQNFGLPECIYGVEVENIDRYDVRDDKGKTICRQMEIEFTLRTYYDGKFCT